MTAAGAAVPARDERIRKMEDQNRSDECIALGNLHDVFLNASLCHSKMLESPVEQEVWKFTISPRGRFERMWITYLYVLVEAWRSPFMAGAKSLMNSVYSSYRIDALISQGEKDGSLSKMKNVRDYMCHRDKREYWDAGRTDVAGRFQYNEILHEAFSEAFLAALVLMSRGEP